MKTREKTPRSGLLEKISHPIDLTQGTPWKVILRYSAPIILSYLLQQIYVLTDAIICGQVLTAEEVAGVNDTFPLTFIFLQFAFGCTAGFSVITAKCVGAADMKGARQSFVVQTYLSVAISAFLTVVSVLSLPWMLRLINVTPENAEVYNAAYNYCIVIFLGIIAQMGYNFICGILRAYGDSVTPLIFLVISTALNVGLDLLFLIPLDMGPTGAAVATVLAQAISVVICAIYTFIRYEDLRIRKEDWRVSGSYVSTHIKNGLPLGFQFSILAVGILVMQGSVVKFDLNENGLMVAGTPAQNGFGAANKMINFLLAFYNGLGSAILGFNAQNYGKYRFEQAKREKESRKNQKTIEVKETRLSLNIDTHDFDTKVNQTKKFLSSGNRVKVSIRFRGREMAHSQLGYGIMQRFAEACADVGNVEKPAKLEGRSMIMFMNAKPAPTNKQQ